MSHDISEFESLICPEDYKCVVCGNDLIRPNRYCVCKNCTLEVIERCCSICGKPTVGLEQFCETCNNFNRGFDEARSIFVFKDSTRRLIERLKYGNGLYLISYINEFMIDRLFSLDWEYDFITYVPMHPANFRKRGYNQVQHIAEGLAKRTFTPIVQPLRRTSPERQTHKPASERLLLDHTAFAPLAVDRRLIHHRRALLIDDVMTTGSTLSACAKALKKCGVSIVYGLTFAATQPPPTSYLQIPKETIPQK